MTELEAFFAQLSKCERDLVIAALDLQLSTGISCSEKEKQDRLEALIVNSLSKSTPG